MTNKYSGQNWDQRKSPDNWEIRIIKVRIIKVQLYQSVLNSCRKLLLPCQPIRYKTKDSPDFTVWTQEKSFRLIGGCERISEFLVYGTFAWCFNNLSRTLTFIHEPQNPDSDDNFSTGFQNIYLCSGCLLGMWFRWFWF